VNPDLEDLYNSTFHMADICNDQQADRDWVRRLSRDKESESNHCQEGCQHKDDDCYPEDNSHQVDDDTRERHSYENVKGDAKEMIAEGI
jgi:hypothetical protein